MAIITIKNNGEEDAVIQRIDPMINTEKARQLLLVGEEKQVEVHDHQYVIVQLRRNLEGR